MTQYQNNPYAGYPVPPAGANAGYGQGSGSYDYSASWQQQGQPQQLQQPQKPQQLQQQLQQSQPQQQQVQLEPQQVRQQQLPQQSPQQPQQGQPPQQAQQLPQQPQSQQQAQQPQSPQQPQQSQQQPQQPNQQQPQQPSKQKKSKTPLIVVICVLACLLVAGLGYVVLNNTVFVSKNVALIHMEGTIGEDAGACNAEGLLSLLSQAEQDSSVAAVVLRVDSGGGYSAQGEEMAQYIKNFSKPIVVSSGSTNASAAYFISSQADYIYANDSSLVGSIGTIMQFINYSDLLKMLGVDAVSVESSPSKDSSYGTRALTEEEIAYYQNQVDKINQVFIEAVSEGRNMNVDDVKKLATGMTFTGSESVQNGLIDEVGTLSDACKKAASLAGLSHYGIVTLDSTSSYDELLKLLNGN